MEWFNEHKCDEEWSSEELRHKLADARRRVAEDGEYGRRLDQDAGEAAEPETVSNRPIPPFPEYQLAALGLRVRAIEHTPSPRFDRVRYEIAFNNAPLGDLLATTSKKNAPNSVINSK